MEDASNPFLSRQLVDQTPEEDGGEDDGCASQMIQCGLIAITRAFDAQQCFITTFADSTSYPSNIITEWSLEDASALLTSLPSASFFAGCFAGGFVIPLADSRLGRKKLLLMACLIMSLSSLLTATLSTNIFLYSALRFASGFGRAPIGTSSLVLSTEIVGPRWRSYVGILGFVLFSIGFASLPAIAFLNRHSSWRRLYLWTSLPALAYCLIIYFFVKESRRWMRLQRSTTDTYSAVRTLVSSKWACRRLALGMVLTFGLGCADFGMPLGLGSLSFNLYISVAMEALIELPSALLAFYLIGRMNRRSSLIATTALSGICSVACGAMGGSSWAQVVLELVAFLIANTAYDIGLIYMSELFPTCVRNSAVAVARQMVVLGGILGAVLAEMGGSWKNELVSYGGFGAVLMVCGLFVLWLPETRGTESCDTMDEEESKKTLEQI